MKPHWWHLTLGPVTVTFETTFFLAVVGVFAVRDERQCVTRQDQEHGRAEHGGIRDLRSTATSSLQGEPLDV